MTALTIGSCSDSKDDEGSGGKPSPNKPFIILGSEKVEAKNAEGTYSVDVETNIAKLDVTSSQDWCKATCDDKKITLQVSANPDAAIRTTKVTVKGENLVKDFTVTQSGSDPFLEISTDTIEAEGTEGSYEVGVETNIADIKITSSHSWCVATYADGKIKVEVSLNPDTEERTAQIIVKGADFSKTIAVTQKGIDPYMNLDTTEIEAGAKEATYEVKVETNIADINVTSSESWCEATYANGKLIIKVSTNPVFEPREATVTITGNDFIETIKVSQVAGEPFLELKENALTVKSAQGIYNVAVETNIDEVTATSNDEWIEPTYADGNLAIKVSANAKLSKRTGNVTVNTGEFQEVVTVIQEAREANGEDMLVPVDNAWTNTFQPNGGEIENCLNGTFEKNYHSKWTDEISPQNPAILEFNFVENPTIDYLIYHPRQIGVNGNFGELEIWVEANGKPSTKYGDFDFKKSGKASTIIFDTPMENVKQIRFVVKTGTNNNASCCQMLFYVVNEQ